MTTPDGEGPLLAVDEVSVHFGGVRAVQGVSLRLQPGTLYGLVGPNGSGKTTLLGALSRVTHTDAGRLVLDGTDYTRWTPDRVAGLGIARTFQGIRLVRSLDVDGNVRLGADLGRGRVRGIDWWVGRRRAAASEAVTAAASASALEMVGLAELGDADPSTLSYGLQRRVEIARAVAMEPRLLLLDEPTAGMREGERDEIIALALRLREQGMTILLVEHNLRMINALCDHVFVMDFGRCIASGPPATVMQDPAVRAAYLGEVTDARSG